LDHGVVRGAVVTFVDITERRRAAQALQLAKDELEVRVAERTEALASALKQVRELAAWSEAVREDERTRIAREVHDELGSLLVALKMDVNWMDKRLSEQDQRSAEAAGDMRLRMRGKCQNMSRLIENAVVNVGRIITDLRPSILDHQGLWAALEWQAQEFVQAAELQLDWAMDLDGSSEPPEPLAMAVFRIFQEMLSNVGRHAQASQLRVGIAVRDCALTLTVQDNGVGADPLALAAATAYGVQGMRERAHHFGGQLRIEGAPQQGTAATLSISWSAPSA
jgi:signal transduction histidine kinase